MGNGNNEFGGFEISTSGSVQNYIAFGTFNSPYRVQRRSATFTLNTTGLRNIGVWLIAGNDKNGGERSNNSSSESVYHDILRLEQYLFYKILMNQY